MAAPATLCPATRRDAAEILRLEEAGMRSYAEALWGNWEPSAAPATLALDGHEMILVSRRSVGCIASECHPDHLSIRKLYIAPAHQGRGLGALILQEKLRTAAAQEIATRLSVLATNTGAQRFYRRQGFVCVRTTKERLTFEWTPPLNVD